MVVVLPWKVAVDHGRRDRIDREDAVGVDTDGGRGGIAERGLVGDHRVAVVREDRHPAATCLVVGRNDGVVKVGVGSVAGGFMVTLPLVAKLVPDSSTPVGTVVHIKGSPLLGGLGSFADPPGWSRWAVTRAWS